MVHRACIGTVSCGLHKWHVSASTDKKNTLGLRSYLSTSAFAEAALAALTVGTSLRGRSVRTQVAQLVVGGVLRVGDAVDADVALLAHVHAPLLERPPCAGTLRFQHSLRRYE